MSTSFKVITPPTVEPITVTDIKNWIRINWPDNDAVIANAISRARSTCETITHRAWATQQIQEVYTIERPIGGELSGTIGLPPNWYHYNQMIGANPFGASQFYFDTAMPPIDTTQPVVIETKVVAFDPWTVFPQFTNPDGSTNTYVDNNCEPARIYVHTPVTSNFWRFTYTAGYSSTYPLPPDLLNCLVDLVAYYYGNRDGGIIPKSIMDQLLAKRTDWV
jgi:hypothetical protein